MMNYQHWKHTKDAENIVWLGLDRKGVSVNTLNSEVLDELNSLLQEISQTKETQGVVIYSLKEKGFIAGADISEFSKFTTQSEYVHFLQKGKAVFQKIEALPLPVIALINGFCLGGGLELALACDYRIATDSEDTSFALPEVMLGFLPGWGGSVRLPRQIGGFNALSRLMLTGLPIKAKAAKKIGLVDDVVPLRQLHRAGKYYLLRKPEKHEPSLIQRLTNTTPGRRILSPILRYQVAKKVKKQHYPAPFAIIDFWDKEGVEAERAYLKETDAVVKLISEGETARNLIRAFSLRERLKSFGKEASFHATHVHVVGAGVMGGDIAAWCALRGLRVTLQDESFAKIAPAMKRASELFQKKLKEPRLVMAARDRLIPDPEGDGISKADVIIEAVFEKLEVKHTVIKGIEEKAKSTALIASNTSSIPLDAMSTVMKNPERLVGIHYFNPVSKMELVEVVASEKTSKEIQKQAMAFVGQIGKLPLPVRSVPGFLVNRILMPYLMEAVFLLQEGWAPEEIDQEAKAFGMLMGPVELADVVGMDVCLMVAENLIAQNGGEVPELLYEMVKEGKLGRKTGEGFYRYRNGKPIQSKIPSGKPLDDVAMRLVFCIIKEAEACLKEHVVTDADLVDAGMIFGAGFAPFRGGPMNYAKHAHDNLNEVFAKLKMQYGGRFKKEMMSVD